MLKLIHFVVSAATLSIILFTSHVKAGLILNVTYTDGRIVSGPLSFGLTELPINVNATFELELPPPSPGGPIAIPYPHFFSDIDEVLVASFNFGNLSLTTADLARFEMNTDANGVLENLTYQFGNTGGDIILNFPLTITGSNGAEAFEYRYETATYTFTQVSEPTGIALFTLGILGFSRVRRFVKLPIGFTGFMQFRKRVS